MKYTTLSRCNSGLSHLFTNPTKTMSTENQIERRIDKTTTGQTGLTPTGAMAFNSMNQIMEFAKVMAIASIAIPKHLRDNPGACLGVAIQASEWQMSPFAVANKTYCVNDRLGYEAQLVNAVILRRAPIVGRMKIEYSGEGDARKCKVSAKCSDGDSVEYESPAFGKITTKNSPLWKADPDQQLFYYSSRAMCRRHFPDVLLGVYTVDELQDREERPAKGREVQPAEVPLLFSGVAAVPAVEARSDSAANAAAAPRELTAREEFWERCDLHGFAFANVCFLLNRADFLGIQEPEDMTADEASRALHSWDKLVELYGKEAA